MAREKGSKNFSPREQRLVAKIEALKAELRAQKDKFLGKLKVREARIKELKQRIG